MPEKKEKAVVPRLRFPEFRNAGPWEVKRLGEVCKITNGDSNAQDHNDNGLYPLFDRSEVVKKSNKYLFDCEAVIIPGEGMSFTPKYYFGKFDLHQRAYALVDFLDSGRFIYYQMDALKSVLANKAVLSTVLSLRIPILEKFRITFPALEEQQKIANCLASLDDLIRAEEEQLAALKAHKKGLMQQLFPREGETTPRLRFPEFRNAGPWEVKRLGEICTFLKGKGLPKTAITPSGSVPCVHYGELFTDYGEVIRIVKSFTNSSNNYVLSEEDDVLMPTSDVTPNGLAKASCLKRSNVVLGGDILVIRLNKDLVFGEYLSRLIRFREQEVLRYVSGTTIFHLYPNSISKFRVSLPSLPEQQKIADCLASLDGLIQAKSERIDALKQHKKGLMQQLFPQEVG